MIKVRQIEITAYVNQNLDEIDNILSKQGFKIIRKSRVEDKYMLHKDEPLTKNNILSILTKCLLIRYLCINNDKEVKSLTYKKKDYKGDTSISEEKIVLSIEDIEQAEKLFNALNFRKIVDVNYDVIVYKKDEVELCFQLVEDLGLLVEYENIKDFKNVSQEEIIKEKERMLEELRSYQLQVSDDYDVKKAYQLIKNRMERGA